MDYTEKIKKHKKEIHKANKKKGQGAEIGKHKFMIKYKMRKEKTYSLPNF